MDSQRAAALLDRIETSTAELRQVVSGNGAGVKPTDKFSAGPFTPEGGIETGMTYFWPPKQLDHYREFQRYRSPNGTLFGIGKAAPVESYGRNRPYVVVHELGGHDQLNAVVVFTAADDWNDSKELLSIVKGNGPGGRKMFRPGDALPTVYDSARIEDFSSRIQGPRTRKGLALVCNQDDYDGMLTHAVLQRKLRAR